MSKQYIGKAPFTMARTAVGGYVNVLKDDPAPSGLNEEDLKRLVDEGYLEEVAAPDESAAADPNEPPAKSANKGEWVAFATAEERGDDRLSEEDANTLTKEQLVEKFGA